MEENVQNTVTNSISAGITAKSTGDSKENKKQALWLKRLKAEEKAHKDFRARGKDVDEIWHRDYDKEIYIPLYWQIINIEHVGVFSNQPVPDVRPRNEAQNPTMRAVAKTIQRGLSFCVDQQGFDDNMHRAIDDYLAIGLGIARVKVDSIINTEIIDVPIFGQQMTLDQMGQPVGA